MDQELVIRYLELIFWMLQEWLDILHHDAPAHLNFTEATCPLVIVEEVIIEERRLPQTCFLCLHVLRVHFDPSLWQVQKLLQLGSMRGWERDLGLALSFSKDESILELQEIVTQ